MRCRLPTDYPIFREIINVCRDDGQGSRFSFGLSVLVHAVALASLALFAISRSHIAEVEAVFAEIGQPAPEARIDPPSQVLHPAMLGSSAGGRSGAGGEIAAGIETAGQPHPREWDARLSLVESASPLDFAPSLPAAKDLNVSALGKRLGKGFAAGGGFGSGVGDGQGDGSGSQFFELATAGTRFVYVLDGSGSMTEPHSEARTRLDRVKIELIRSIGGLPGEMEFFVIFFNKIAVPMPAEKLQSATLPNKRKYLEWCMKVKGGGGTDPRAAIKQALELNPDVIYLLTDGVFDDGAAEEATTLNTRGVSIHTFCFGDASGEALLKDMARRNHGTYKFIP